MCILYMDRRGLEMRLIDADALLKSLVLYINRSSLGEITVSTELSIGEICSLIKDQPTIEVNEPVNKYCLNCGTKNDGGIKDERI